jgi:hypothetical protein
MARGKSGSHLQHERVLTVLASNPQDSGEGREVGLEEIATVLGDSVHMYRLSVYMYNIKKMGIVVRSVRDGRKVVAYQIPANFMKKAAEMVAAKSAAPVQPAGRRMSKMVASSVIAVPQPAVVEEEELEEA